MVAMAVEAAARFFSERLVPRTLHRSKEMFDFRSHESSVLGFALTVTGTFS